MSFLLPILGEGRKENPIPSQGEREGVGWGGEQVSMQERKEKKRKTCPALIIHASPGCRGRGKDKTG